MSLTKKRRSIRTQRRRQRPRNAHLLPLAPDVPQAAQVAQYEYRVTALDGAGRELASSADPLSRFSLSQQARNVLMELEPPMRGGPGRGRFRRRMERR